MEYRTLRNGQKISTIGIGVGNYGYENVSCAEVESIFVDMPERMKEIKSFFQAK